MIGLYVMAIFYILAGLNHFRVPAFYRPMMPPWVPRHNLMIAVSGLAEVFLGLLLLSIPTRTLGAWGVVLLLIAFLPVHIYMYQGRKTVFRKFPTAIIIARIPLQFVLMAWALLYVVHPHWTLTPNVAFKPLGAHSLQADVYIPDGDGLYPGVIVVHGGGWRKRSGDMEFICQQLAQAGFVVFNTTYRLAPPDLYPAAVDDVKDAIRFFKNNAAKYHVDPAKLSGWGYSAGANLILLAGLDSDLGLKAIVAGGTPAELTAWPHSPLVFGFLGQTFDQNPELWQQASPVNHVTTNSPPVFLYHGAWDQLVEVEQMDRMAAALRAKSRRVETYAASYMGHIVTYVFSQEAIDRGIAFLRRELAVLQ